jgi:hypothetical protein
VISLLQKITICQINFMHKTSTFLLLYLICNYLSAQINLTALSPTVNENFNTLPNSGASTTWTDNSTLANWYSDRASFIINDGSVATVGLQSFGASASTERALGSVGGTTHFAIRLKNNDVQNIVSLDVSFVGEQWRENINTSILEFQYQVVNAGGIADANSPSTGWIAVSTLDFAQKFNTTAQALNGNLSTNQTNKSATIPLTATPGQEIWLRWRLAAGTNKCGLGIDNLSIIANYPIGCSAPSLQASNITFSALSPLNFNIGCTAGNGTARLIIGKQGMLPTAPSQNDDYSGFDNTTWNAIIPTSNEIPPIGSNQYALYDGIGNSINVSALLPETQYCFSIFEYQGLHCYNLTPVSRCIFSLSTEPTVNSNVLTSAVVSATQINLNFQSMVSAGLPTTNHGYIILQNTGTVPTEIPVDGTGYVVDNAVGTAKVAAIITDPTVTSTSVTSLLSSTQYCFTIYSYRWNGMDSGTINYYTPMIVPNSCGIMLPVELVSFTGSCLQNNEVELQWTTASEQNSDSFFIEKSTDGSNFIIIGSVAAAGNSTEVRKYSFTDSEISSSKNYYRITVLDKDNSIDKSKIIQIKCSEDEEIKSYYSNLTDDIIIELNAVAEKDILINLIDITGKSFFHANRKTTIGINKIRVPIKHSMPNGIYIVSIKDGNNSFTKKILLNRK